MNRKPEFIKGEILKQEYDGISNDLLTGGLGKTGLQGPPPKPEIFTATHLRTLAIYTAYRGLVDIKSSGGFGRLYGPNVSSDRTVSDTSEGKIPGKEYLAFSDDGSGKQNVTLMVQIPSSFDPAHPCIITAPSSGSRGIYGGVPLAGEWGLKRGFAVAYTDKGTGTGIHDLDSNTVNIITGERMDADEAGNRSNFTAVVDQDYKRRFPHRFAFKHAHSEQNPQADWGKHVLQSIEFAFYVLNLEENFGKVQSDGTVKRTITPENTIVIASGLSNGGDAALRAAEQDEYGWIDGVAVSEPNICPIQNKSVIIRQGNKQWTYPNHSRNLLDYSTLLNIYQPCANLSPAIKPHAPLNLINEQVCINRCMSLAQKGLLKSSTIDEMAMEAQSIINDYGILEEQNLIAPSHSALQITEGICIAYANAYGRFRVQDSLCGFSFAAVDPETKSPTPYPENRLKAIFGESTGIAPTPVAGIEIINDRSLGGPKRNSDSISQEGIMDHNLDGALCLRRLTIGYDEAGEPLVGEELEYHKRIAQGVNQVRATGKLRHLPVLIVHGRQDAILPPNHTSRAYVALNNLVEGDKSRVRYYEVTHAHHLDFLNGFAGFDSKFVPLVPYYFQILDYLYDHLAHQAPLPDSQVVRTIPRGILDDGTVPEISPANVPPIVQNPPDVNRITIQNGTIQIPD